MIRTRYASIYYVLILLGCTGFRLLGVDQGDGVAFAKTIFVSDLSDQQGSRFRNLRQAIEEANRTPGSDTIVFPIATRSAGKITLKRGELVISRQVNIRGPGWQKLSIDGDGKSRIFRIRPGIEVTISGLSLNNGKASFGGAILNEGTLTLSQSLLATNMGTSGGAIENKRNAKLKLKKVTLQKNTATVGGAIMNRPKGEITIDDSLLDGNIAVDQCGAVSNQGIATVTDSTLKRNEAKGADGGAFCNESELTIDKTSINDNKASREGGGFFLESGMLTAVNSTLSGNQARFGAAISSTRSSRFSLYHVTITNNDARSDAAINLERSARGFLRNTIVANQKRGGDCKGDQPFVRDFNLDSDGACVDSPPRDGDKTARDAKLKPRNKEGVHEPNNDSPAVDGGTPTKCQGPTGTLTTDQLGRRRVQNRACDIGAVEVKHIRVDAIVDLIDINDRPIFEPVTGRPKRNRRTFRNSANMDVKRNASNPKGQGINAHAGALLPQGAKSDEIMCQLDQDSIFACDEGLWTLNDLEPGMMHTFCVTAWESSPETGEALLTGEDCIIWDILTPQEGLDDLVTRLETLMALQELDVALGTILIEHVASMRFYLERHEIDVVVELLQDLIDLIQLNVDDAQLSPEAGQWLTEIASALSQFLNPAPKLSLGQGELP